MLSKATRTALGGHTAGIFADMSVDGPEIGTLVTIIDRAKNLPNRKTMGKQNPYCACRLGKEAKKTGTDMRGGQTPKWDQELRFTVHESPDYYQLKVSIFNDDKKTDLIGETWIDLKKVVIPGGGQSDQWHGLTFKGKYAGDVRIELTYYDTRPKDEAVIERRKEAEKQEMKAEGGGGGGTLTGSRQMKQTKRRPLPADPTGSSSARPASSGRDHAYPPPAPRARPEQQQQQLKPTPAQPRVYETPDDFQRQWTPLPNADVEPQHPYANTSRNTFQQPPVDAYELPAPIQPQATMPISMPSPRDHSYPPADLPPMPNNSGYGYDPVQNGHDYDYPSNNNAAFSRNVYETPPRQSNHQMFTPDQHGYSMPPTYPPSQRGSPYGAPLESTGQPPDLPPPRHTGSSGGDGRSPYHRYSSSPNKNVNDPYRDSPLRNSVNPAEYHSPPQEYMQPHVQDDEEDEGPPPPPPAHRNGVAQMPTREMAYTEAQAQPIPIPMPEPLNAPAQTPLTTLNGGSRQSYVAYSPEYGNSVLPQSDRQQRYSVSPTPYQNQIPYTQRDQGVYDRPPTSDSGNGNMPVSLVPGYDNAVIPEPEPPIYDDPRDIRQSSVPAQPAPPSTYDMDPRHARQTSVPPPQSSSQTSSSQQLVRTSPGPQGLVQAQTQQDRPSSQTSRKSISSSDPRKVPPRKSISPHPPPLAASSTSSSQPGSSLSTIPFGPDSYDALNPHASDSLLALQQPERPYETPEEAMEAARMREVQKLRDVGPIIGNDGRVIDPSDHLPTDTWAPEPERKNEKRKPEIVVRFKKQPQSSSSGGRGSRESTPGSVAGRPHSVANPGYAQRASQHGVSAPQSIDHGSIPPSLQSSGRNRLQKQAGRPQSYIQSSSPGSTVGAPSNQARIQPRPAGSTSPSATQSYHNSHSHSHSHSYSTSPTSPGHYYQMTGPPIPAKVPIHPGTSQSAGTGFVQGAGGGEYDALSEEMKRIDIGGGGGGRVGAGRSARGRISYSGY